MGLWSYRMVALGVGVLAVAGPAGVPALARKPREKEGRDVEMSVVKVGLGLVLLAAMMLGGCAGLSSSTPFNPAQSCLAAGGTYSNGQCRAGNA